MISVSKMEPYGFPFVFPAKAEQQGPLPGWRRSYMSIGTIILIILVIALLGGFSGIGGKEVRLSSLFQHLPVAVLKARVKRA